MISKSNQALYQIYRNKDAIQSAAGTYRKTNNSSVPELQSRADTKLQGDNGFLWSNAEIKKKKKKASEHDGGNRRGKRAVIRNIKFKKLV